MAAPTPSRKRKPLNAARCLAAAATLSAACSFAHAAPEDDYKAGLLAYRRGDMTAAMTGLRKAADAGVVRAQTLLAYVLDQADLDEEAVRYYRMAVERGDAEAQAGLAGLYASGEGVKRDPAQALVLFEKSAAQGYQPAITALAQAYLSNGLGLAPGKRDDARAVAALRAAAAVGYVPAMNGLARAYRSGEFALAPDAAEAARWEAKAVALAPRPAAAGR